ncbi:hypothetical protein SEA_HOLLIDAY_80 [Gordonia phage Holliday]|nr:hypothetical protein SEA_HOLLIDAY_80 [Gordonia phage Holliday]
MPSDTPTPAEIVTAVALVDTDAFSENEAATLARVFIAALAEHYHLLPKAGLSISVTRAADVAEEQR